MAIITREGNLGNDEKWLDQRRAAAAALAGGGSNIDQNLAWLRQQRGQAGPQTGSNIDANMAWMDRRAVAAAHASTDSHSATLGRMLDAAYGRDGAEDGAANAAEIADLERRKRELESDDGLSRARAMASRRFKANYSPSERLANAYAAADADRVAMLAQAQRDYDAQKAELLAQWQLAPTASEKQRLNSQLARLEQQKTYAHKTINATYAKGIADIDESRVQQRADANKSGNRAYRNYKEAGQDLDALRDNAAQTGSAGGRLGNAGGPTGVAAIGAEDMIRHGARARQRALTEGDAMVAALRRLAGGMTQARAASHVETNDLVTGLVADTQLAWDERVSDRIAADTAARNAALAQLTSAYNAQRMGLQQAGSDAALELALTEVGRRDAAVQDAAALNAGQRDKRWDLALDADATERERKAAELAEVNAALRRLTSKSTSGGDDYYQTVPYTDEKGVTSNIEVTNATYQNQYDRLQALLDSGDPDALGLASEFESDPVRRAWMKKNGVQFGY